MDFTKILDFHIKTYPLMSSDDALKAAYQSAFGAAHFNANSDAAKSLIEKEIKLFPESESCPETFPLGDYSRLELKNPHVRKLGAEIIGKLFCISAGEDRKKIKDEKSFEQFENNLKIIEEYVKCGKLCSGAVRIGSMYGLKNPPAPSHSDEYKKLYCPSYRVISQKYIRALPLISKIKELTESKGVITVGIDGHCASGKTTTAKIISSVFKAPCISMDSFFLPPDRKTPERLAEAGGNIDYERFAEEVLPHLCTGKSFSYYSYNCRSGSKEKITVPDFSLITVEGVYTLRKEFQPLYDITVFSDISKSVQTKRLKKRSPVLFDRFQREWIPMENKYFDTFKIKDKCSLILYN